MRPEHLQRATMGDVPQTLATMGDEMLERDAVKLATRLGLKGSAREPQSEVKKMIDAAFVARNPDVYERVARRHVNSSNPSPNNDINDLASDADLANSLPVKLERLEMTRLLEEKGKLFSETNILLVTLAVSAAAFLQGHVQASINGSSLFRGFLGLKKPEGLEEGSIEELHLEWKLGAINSMPFFTAALLGCWLALPLNDRFGRRGALAISALLILVSSLVSGLAIQFQHLHDRWLVFLGLRIVNGLGMGIKAVSAPILASETAIRFWRGSFLLAWQLWVAFGIMMGNLINLCCAQAQGNLAPALMLAAPVIPSVVLLLSLWASPESPRYYLRGGEGRYQPEKALKMLLKLRGGDDDAKLFAYKDMYLLHKTIEEEYTTMGQDYQGSQERSLVKLGKLFTSRRLRNAMISSSTVNLAQQLCGINVSAIYSGTFFVSFIPDDNEDRKILTALGLGLCFGGVNWLFGLPAIKTIDTLGRRKWLIATLPLMCVLMGAAAYSFPLPYVSTEQASQTLRLVATFIFLHAAVYSPGLGPIPFTLASESFPSSHREVGCAFAISINLFFAGVLTILFPTIQAKLKPPGALFLFCGLTFLAWVLVYFLVEETRELSLESLSGVFSNQKCDFINFKYRRLIWLLKRYVLRDTTVPEPEMIHTPIKDAEKAPPVSVTPLRAASISTEHSDLFFSR